MPASVRRVLAGVVAVATLAVAPASYAVSQAPHAAAIPMPKTPKFGTAIESFAPYQPQAMCDPTAKPGVLKFRALLLATYPTTGDDGITRACNVGDRSEHKEGRAWDWAVSVKNPRDVRIVHTVFHWLFATDVHGNKDAVLRRLGIMYIIWNKRIWEPDGGGYSYGQTEQGGGHWSPYSCSGFTACHRNHVHFSFGWAGALAKTSYWTHKVSPELPAPVKIINDRKLPRTMHVDAADTFWWTPFALTKHHHYLLTVTGTAARGWDGQRDADAVCTVHSDGEWYPWVEGNTTGLHRLFDLTVNGHSAWKPVANDGADPGNGCDATHHRYVLHFTPHMTGRWHLFVRTPPGETESGSFTVRVSRDVARKVSPTS